MRPVEHSTHNNTNTLKTTHTHTQKQLDVGATPRPVASKLAIEWPTYLHHRGEVRRGAHWPPTLLKDFEGTDESKFKHALFCLKNEVYCAVVYESGRKPMEELCLEYVTTESETRFLSVENVRRYHCGVRRCSNIGSRLLATATALGWPALAFINDNHKAAVFSTVTVPENAIANWTHAGVKYIAYGRCPGSGAYTNVDMYDANGYLMTRDSVHKPSVVPRRCGVVRIHKPREGKRKFNLLEKYEQVARKRKPKVTTHRWRRALYEPKSALPTSRKGNFCLQAFGSNSRHLTGYHHAVARIGATRAHYLNDPSNHIMYMCKPDAQISLGPHEYIVEIVGEYTLTKIAGVIYNIGKVKYYAPLKKTKAKSSAAGKLAPVTGGLGTFSFNTPKPTKPPAPVFNMNPNLSDLTILPYDQRPMNSGMPQARMQVISYNAETRLWTLQHQQPTMNVVRPLEGQPIYGTYLFRPTFVGTGNLKAEQDEVLLATHPNPYREHGEVLQGLQHPNPMMLANLIRYQGTPPKVGTPEYNYRLAVGMLFTTEHEPQVSMVIREGREDHVMEDLNLMPKRGKVVQPTTTPLFYYGGPTNVPYPMDAPESFEHTIPSDITRANSLHKAHNNCSKPGVVMDPGNGRYLECVNCHSTVYDLFWHTKMYGHYNISANDLHCGQCGHPVFFEGPLAIFDKLETVNHYKSLGGPELMENYYNSLFPETDIPLSNRLKNIIDSHDARTIAGKLNSLRPWLVKVPCPTELKNYPGVQLIGTESSGSNFDSQATSSYAALTTMAARATRDGLAVYGLDNQVILPAQAKAVGTNQVVERKTANRLAIIANRADADILTTELKAGIDAIWLIVPRTKANAWHTTITQHAYIFSPETTNISVALPRILMEALDKQVIVAGDYVYMVQHQWTDSYNQLIKLVAITHYNDLNKYILMGNVNERLINVPVIHPTSIGSTLGLRVEMMKVHFNPKMFEIAIRRNMHKGEVSYDSLVETMIGLAMQRYNMATKTVPIIQTDSTEIVGHAYLAYMMTKLTIARSEKLVDYMLPETIEQDLTNTGKMLFMSAVEWALRKMNLRSETTQGLFASLLRNTPGAILEECAIHFNEISKELSSANLMEVKVGDLNSETKITCEHKLPIQLTVSSAWTCECCNQPSGTARCTGCSVPTCEHDCQQSHIEQTVKCQCCHHMAESNPCRMCDDTTFMDKDEVKATTTALTQARPAASQAVPKLKPQLAPSKSQRQPWEEYNFKGVAVMHPGEPAQITEGNTHIHLCKCGQYYSHTHKGTDDQPPHPMHPLFKGDCPWHEGNTKNTPLLLIDGMFVRGDPNLGTVNPDDAQDLQLVSVKTRLLVHCPEEFVDYLEHRKTDLDLSPYLLTGSHSTKKSRVQIIEMPSSENCAIHAIMHSLPDLDRVELQVQLGEPSGIHSEEEIISAAKQMNFNVGFVFPHATVAHICTPGGPIAWLVHNTAAQQIDAHWDAGRVEFYDDLEHSYPVSTNPLATIDDLGALTKHYTKGMSVGWDLDLLDVKTRFLVELHLSNAIQSVKNQARLPTLTKIVTSDGVHEYFTNSSTHKPEEHKFKVVVPNSYSTYLDTAINGTAADYVSDKFNVSFNLDAKLEALHEEMRYRFIGTCKDFLYCRTMVQQPNDTYTSKKVVAKRAQFKTIGKVSWLELPDTVKWKRGDLVHLMDQKGNSTPLIVQPVTMNREGGSLGSFTVAEVDVTAPLTMVYSERLSFSSLTRAIVAMCQETGNVQNTIEAIRNASGFTGPGGAGKSIRIAQEMNETTVAVACTRGAQRSIQKYLKFGDADCGLEPKPHLTDRVYSLERAMYAGIISCQKVLLDEANQIRPWQLAAFMPANCALKCFWDDTQIGYVDYTNLPGLRTSKSVTDYVENPEIVNTQYRIAAPLADVIDQVRPGGYKYVGKPKETNFDLTILPQTTTMEPIILALNRHRVDAIYVFFQNDYNRVLAAVKNLKVNMAVELITTVHSGQGNVFKKVAVLQRRYGRPGIEVDPHYLMSAVTRCSEYLHWISVGLHGPGTELSSILKGSKIGAGILSHKVTGLDEIVQKLSAEYGKSNLKVTNVSLDTEAVEAIKRQMNKMGVTGKIYVEGDNLVLEAAGALVKATYNVTTQTMNIEKGGRFINEEHRSAMLESFKKAVRKDQANYATKLILSPRQTEALTRLGLLGQMCLETQGYICSHKGVQFEITATIGDPLTNDVTIKSKSTTWRFTKRDLDTVVYVEGCMWHEQDIRDLLDKEYRVDFFELVAKAMATSQFSSKLSGLLQKFKIPMPDVMFSRQKELSEQIRLALRKHAHSDFSIDQTLDMDVGLGSLNRSVKVKNSAGAPYIVHWDEGLTMMSLIAGTQEQRISFQLQLERSLLKDLKAINKWFNVLQGATLRGEQGMLWSLSKHLEEDTFTAKAIKDSNSKLIASAISHKEQSLFMSPNAGRHMSYFGSNVRGADITMHNTVLTQENVLELYTQMAMFHLQKQAHGVDVATNVKWLTIESRLRGFKAILADVEPRNKAEWDSSTGAAMRAAQAMASIKPKQDASDDLKKYLMNLSRTASEQTQEEGAYWGTPENKTLLVGLQHLPQSPEQLVVMTRTYERVYLVLPLFCQCNDDVYYDSELQVGLKQPKWLHEAIETARSDHQAGSLTYKMVVQMGQTALVEVLPNTNQLVRSLKETSLSGHVKITYPVIREFNLDSTVKPVVETRTMIVPKNLHNFLAVRASRPGTTIQDLRTAYRTQANSIDYTSMRFASKQNLFVTDGIDLCTVEYLHNYYLRSSLEEMGHKSQPGMLESLKQGFQSEISALFNLNLKPSEQLMPLANGILKLFTKERVVELDLQIRIKDVPMHIYDQGRMYSTTSHKQMAQSLLTDVVQTAAKLIWEPTPERGTHLFMHLGESSFNLGQANLKARMLHVPGGELWQGDETHFSLQQAMQVQAALADGTELPKPQPPPTGGPPTSAPKYEGPTTKQLLTLIRTVDPISVQLSTQYLSVSAKRAMLVAVANACDKRPGVIIPAPAWSRLNQLQKSLVITPTVGAFTNYVHEVTKLCSALFAENFERKLPVSWVGMKVAIHWLGSRGDWEPFKALATTLTRMGANVVVVGPKGVDSGLLDYRELNWSIDEALETHEKMKDPLEAMKQIAKVTTSNVVEDYPDTSDCDYFIIHPISLQATLLAEALQIPYTIFAPMPINLKNSWWTDVKAKAMWAGLYGAHKAWLRTWNTIPNFDTNFDNAVAWRHGSVVTTSVLPNQFDTLLGEHLGTTPVITPIRQSPRTEGGSNTIVITFGSMLRQAINYGKLRSILESLPKQRPFKFIWVGPKPTQSLGPRFEMSATFVEKMDYSALKQNTIVVCHGGAGTLASLIKVKAKIIVVPVAYDQFFWANTGHQAGVWLDANQHDFNADSEANWLIDLLNSDFDTETEQWLDPMRMVSEPINLMEKWLREQKLGFEQVTTNFPPLFVTTDMVLPSPLGQVNYTTQEFKGSVLVGPAYDQTVIYDNATESRNEGSCVIDSFLQFTSDVDVRFSNLATATAKDEFIATWQSQIWGLSNIGRHKTDDEMLALMHAFQYNMLIQEPHETTFYNYYPNRPIIALGATHNHVTLNQLPNLSEMKLQPIKEGVKSAVDPIKSTASHVACSDPNPALLGNFQSACGHLHNIEDTGDLLRQLNRTDTELGLWCSNRAQLAVNNASITNKDVSRCAARGKALFFFSRVVNTTIKGAYILQDRQGDLNTTKRLNHGDLVYVAGSDGKLNLGLIYTVEDVKWLLTESNGPTGVLWHTTKKMLTKQMQTATTITDFATQGSDNAKFFETMQMLVPQQMGQTKVSDKLVLRMWNPRIHHWDEDYNRLVHPDADIETWPAHGATTEQIKDMKVLQPYATGLWAGEAVIIMNAKHGAPVHYNNLRHNDPLTNASVEQWAMGALVMPYHAAKTTMAEYLNNTYILKRAHTSALNAARKYASVNRLQLNEHGMLVGLTDDNFGDAIHRDFAVFMDNFSNAPHGTWVHAGLQGEAIPMVDVDTFEFSSYSYVLGPCVVEGFNITEDIIQNVALGQVYTHDNPITSARLTLSYQGGWLLTRQTLTRSAPVQSVSIVDLAAMTHGKKVISLGLQEDSELCLIPTGLPQTSNQENIVILEEWPMSMSAEEFNRTLLPKILSSCHGHCRILGNGEPHGEVAHNMKLNGQVQTTFCVFNQKIDESNWLLYAEVGQHTTMISNQSGTWTAWDLVSTEYIGELECSIQVHDGTIYLNATSMKMCREMGSLSFATVHPFKYYTGFTSLGLELQHGVTPVSETLIRGNRVVQYEYNPVQWLNLAANMVNLSHAATLELEDHVGYVGKTLAHYIDFMSARAPHRIDLDKPEDWTQQDWHHAASSDHFSRVVELASAISNGALSSEVLITLGNPKPYNKHQIVITDSYTPNMPAKTIQVVAPGRTWFGLMSLAVLLGSQLANVRTVILEAGEELDNSYSKFTIRECLLITNTGIAGPPHIYGQLVPWCLAQAIKNEAKEASFLEELIESHPKTKMLDMQPISSTPYHLGNADPRTPSKYAKILGQTPDIWTATLMEEFMGGWQGQYENAHNYSLNKDSKPLPVAIPTEGLINKKAAFHTKHSGHYVYDGQTIKIGEEIIRNAGVEVSAADWAERITRAGVSKVRIVPMDISDWNKFMLQPEPKTVYVPELGVKGVGVKGQKEEERIYAHGGEVFAGEETHFNAYTEPTQTEFQLGFNSTKLEKAPGAIAMPPGTGKTYLTNKYPHLFVDHDVLNLERQREINALVHVHDWEAVGMIHRMAVVPPGKILLTWSPTTHPTDCHYLGSVIRQDYSKLGISEHRRNLAESNAIHLMQVDRPYIATNHYEVEKFALELARAYNQGEIIDKRKVRNHNIEGLYAARFKDYDVFGPEQTINTKFAYVPYVPVENNAHDASDATDREMVPLDVINFWEDVDLTHDVRVFAPTSEPTIKPIRSSELPTTIVTSDKYTLTNYPMRSRPVLTKMIFGELNAAILRMENRQVFERGDYSANDQAKQTARVCFVGNFAYIISKWKYVTYSTPATRTWLVGRTGYAEIDRELEELDAGGQLLSNLNKLNVHQKLESLLKSKPIMQFREQIVRIIVWQAKAIAAIYSPIFLEAKKRLKQILRPEIVYADGMRPDELSNVLNNYDADESLYYLEDDGDKQDKRTTWRLLDTEMSIYANYLKVHPAVVSAWANCHWMWRYKGTFLRGLCDGMRQTGQATTALGNVIVNLICHTKLVEDLGKDLVIMLVLGDDNLIVARRSIDVHKHKKYCKDKYNLIQECEIHRWGGVFLQMLVCPNQAGKLQSGPDMFRLRNRFEVTNGTTTDPEGAIRARALSYCSMLGDMPRTRSIVAKHGFDIELINYYDVESALAACAKRHNKNLDWARNELSLLLDMLEQPTMYKKQFTHFTCRF